MKIFQIILQALAVQVLHQALEVDPEVHKQQVDALYAQLIWVPMQPGLVADA